MATDGLSGVDEAVISEKLEQGGATPIIGNQGLGRIHICGGGMGKHTSLRVTKSFKLSLNPLIITNRFRRVSERGVNCE